VTWCAWLAPHAHPDQVIGRERHYELEVALLAANEPALGQTTNGLGPAKAFLDPLADRLAGGVTRVADHALIDGR
jgi:hypothetical protein